MSNVAVQSLLVALGGLGMLTGVFVLARRGLLSLRYALGWMAVSVLVVVAALVLVLVGGISNSLPLTPTGLLASVGLAFLVVISLQLSISLSGQQEAIRELSEANALLGERLQRIEDQTSSGEQDDDTDPPASTRSSQRGSSIGRG
jgi:Uncharacterized conserved protein (DUF2304)